MKQRIKEKKEIPQDKAVSIFFNTVGILILIVEAYPLIYVLSASFSSSDAISLGKVYLWPVEFSMEGYKMLVQNSQILNGFKNSIIYMGLGVLLNMSLTMLLAFPLSRKELPGRNLITVFVAVTMYVSGGLVPEYLLITRTLKLGNHFLVYILPGLIWVYNIILIRSFIDGLPIALQEAARIDGANDFIIFAKIVLPLCKPVLATVALFVAVGQWNSFMDTYLYARDLPTLQYVLYEIMEKAMIKVDPHAAEQLTSAVSPMSIRMAITIIATVPILIVYPFLQRYFVGGMTIGAVKD